MTPQPAQSARPSAVDLARESPFTVEEWAHALNALGGRAESLLPHIKGYLPRHAVTPYEAARVFLEATNGS